MHKPNITSGECLEGDFASIAAILPNSGLRLKGRLCNLVALWGDEHSSYIGRK